MPANSMNRVIQHLRSAVVRHYGCALTDGQLLDWFIESHDEAAAEFLVRRHGPMVFGVCRRILRNEADAQDAFQATFLVLVRKASTIRPRDRVGNWLYGVARQTALRAKSAAAKQHQRERQMAHIPEPEVVQGGIGADVVPLLDDELSRLPAKYRCAVVLCDLECKTHKEAARQLGCPEGTLSARVAHGRTMLAKRLSRHGLAVTAGMLTGLLSDKAAAAYMPPTLVSSTLKVIGLASTGKLAAIGVVAANVAAIADGVLKAMSLAKIKIAMATLLMLGAITTTGFVIFRTPEAASSSPLTQPVNAPTKQIVPKRTHLVKVASPLDGIVQFVGSEAPPGEKLPADRFVESEVRGERRRYRRLQKGDTVKEGQLLVRLDPGLAQAHLAAKEGKLLSAKADAEGALSIAQEAESKLKTAEDLYAKRAVSLEEYRSARLTRDKMFFDAIAKKEAVKQAEVELKQTQEVIDSHDIRSGVDGVIVAILKRRARRRKGSRQSLKLKSRTREKKNAKAKSRAIALEFQASWTG